MTILVAEVIHCSTLPSTLDGLNAAELELQGTDSTSRCPGKKMTRRSTRPPARGTEHVEIYCCRIRIDLRLSPSEDITKGMLQR